MSSTSGGKYTRELKLRVLEHYFRNGGDVFGNKQATAKKFGVDSKTINRFLKIHELVRAARRKAKAGGKSAAGSSGAFKEPLVPGTSSRQRTSAKPGVRITMPDEPDEAIVNQTADGNLSSVGKLLKIFELGTQEIRELLLSECELVYECRVCRGLFRSLANLLTHKRRFCTRPHVDTRQVFGCGPGQSLSAPSDGVLVLPLPAAVERLPEVRQAAAAQTRAAAAQPVPTVRLEPVAGTAAAVFQTVGDADRTVGERLAEVRQLQEAAGRTVRLGRNGRIVQSDDDEQADEAEMEVEPERHVCQHCNTIFSTRKTLSHHVRSMHSSTRIYYPCSICSAAFIDLFSVERHLQKVHRKKQEEIEELKEGIKAKSFQRAINEAHLTPAATPGATVKTSSPPAVLGCAECQLRFPSVQLLTGHLMAAHVQPADLTTSDIQARHDYLRATVSSPPPAGLTEEAGVQAPSQDGQTAPSQDSRTASSQDGRTAPSQDGRTAPPLPSDAEMERQMLALCDEKAMRCRRCGKVRRPLWSLRRHVATHTGWTRHGCPRCQFRSYMRSGVVRHMVRVHGMTRPKATGMLDSLAQQQQQQQQQQAGPQQAGAGKRVTGTLTGRPSASVLAPASTAVPTSVSETAGTPAPASTSAPSSIPPPRTYEMRDLTARERPNSPQRGLSRAEPGPIVPPPGAVIPRSSRPASSQPRGQQGRRAGRKTLAAIIHYIRSGAGRAASSAPASPLQSDRADTCGSPAGRPEGADDLEHFQALEVGSELEPDATWRSLLSPESPTAASSCSPPAGQSGADRLARRHPLPTPGGGFISSSESEAAETASVGQKRNGRTHHTADRHDCNENIEQASTAKELSTPSPDAASLDQADGLGCPPAGGGCGLLTSGAGDFYPRVMLTDISPRRTGTADGAAEVSLAAAGPVDGRETRAADRRPAPPDGDGPAAPPSPDRGPDPKWSGVVAHGAHVAAQTRARARCRHSTVAGAPSDAEPVAADSSRPTGGPLRRSISLPTVLPHRSAVARRAFASSPSPADASGDCPPSGSARRRCRRPADTSGDCPPPGPARRRRRRPTPTKEKTAGPGVAAELPPMMRKRSWRSPTDPPDGAGTGLKSWPRQRPPDPQSDRLTPELVPVGTRQGGFRTYSRGRDHARGPPES